MDFALIIVLMGFAEGMTIVYGFLAVIASIMLLWLLYNFSIKNPDLNIRIALDA